MNYTILQTRFSINFPLRFHFKIRSNEEEWKVRTRVGHSVSDSFDARYSSAEWRGHIIFTTRTWICRQLSTQWAKSILKIAFRNGRANNFILFFFSLLYFRYANYREFEWEKVKRKLIDNGRWLETNFFPLFVF